MRHHQVEDDEVITALANLALDERRIAHRLHVEAVGFEQGLHVIADGFVVVDDENTNCGKLDGHRRLRVKVRRWCPLTTELIPVLVQPVSSVTRIRETAERVACQRRAGPTVQKKS
jgi:hypothetical protein